jgi:hypothetical protein
MIIIPPGNALIAHRVTKFDDADVIVVISTSPFGYTMLCRREACRRCCDVAVHVSFPLAIQKDKVQKDHWRASYRCGLGRNPT